MSYLFTGIKEQGSRFRDWERYADNLEFELVNKLIEAKDILNDANTQENRNWHDICENNLKRLKEFKPKIDSYLTEIIGEVGDGDLLDDVVIESKALFERQFRNMSMHIFHIENRAGCI